MDGQHQEQQLRCMHIGVFIRDIGTDASGRWWTHLGFERGNPIVEAQQRTVGRPWSRMVKNGSTTITTNATTNNKLYRFITLLGITEEENQEQH